MKNIINKSFSENASTLKKVLRYITDDLVKSSDDSDEDKCDSAKYQDVFEGEILKIYFLLAQF